MTSADVCCVTTFSTLVAAFRGSFPSRVCIQALRLRSEVFGSDEAAVWCRGGESDAPHFWDEKSRERDESGALHREAFGQDESTQQRLHDDLHSQRPSRLKVQGLFVVNAAALSFLYCTGF